MKFVRKIRSIVESKLLLSPEIDLLLHEHLICNKGGTTGQQRKMFFSIYIAGTIRIPYWGGNEMILTLLYKKSI